MGAAFFPLDDLLGLGAGHQSERVEEGLCWLAAQMPFAQAATGYDLLTGVAVSAKTVERLAERYGAQLAAEDAAVVAHISTAAHQVAVPDQAPATTARAVGVAVDGTMVHLRQAGDWHELKVGTAFTYGPDAAGETVVQQARFCAQRTTAADFGLPVWVMAWRFGLSDEAQVVGLGDAAEWIDNLLESQFPRCTRIVDWYHAKQYLWHVGEVVWGEGSAASQQWGTAQATLLWEGKTTALHEKLAGLPATTDETRRVVGNAQAYLRKHRAHLQYPEFRRQGYPIGSGMVEGACKNLVGARFKRAGMCWSEHGLDALLPLRAALVSGLWDTTWQQLKTPQPSRPLS